jgi:hypothetical protein
MAATTKLSFYNDTLREIGGHALTDLVTATADLTTLNEAFPHAIEYALSLREWNFARRVATLQGVADSTFRPYTHRAARPDDYLRKVWVKASADDEFQADHSEVGLAIYLMGPTALLQYISDSDTVYDPVNWPAHFTRLASLILAQRVAPKLAGGGIEIDRELERKIATATGLAARQEAVFLTNTPIPTERAPVMRRALEMMGQQLAGSIAVFDHTDHLRWHMQRSWSHSVRLVLEQGDWNHATQRVRLEGGLEQAPGQALGDIIRGMSVAPPLSPAGGEITIDSTAITIDRTTFPEAEVTTTTSSVTPLMEWRFGYALPEDFLHKVWLKRDPNDVVEIPHQFMRHAVYTNEEPVVMEYVALSDYSTDPTVWSALFTDAVAAHLALSVAPQFMVETGGEGAKIDVNQVRGQLERMFLAQLSNAKTRDAIQQYPKERPAGRFAQARRGGRFRSRGGLRH